VLRALDEIVQHVLPGHAPLPTHWDGPVERAPEAVAPTSS
jgi:hypothetical protein